MTDDVTSHGSRACCTDFELSRRRFLGRLGAGAAGLAAPTAFGGAFRQVAYGAPAGSNVVVVLSLRGGADGLSMVIPHTEPTYYSLRPTTSIPADRLLRRDAAFGLHPALAPLVPMWAAGSFGAVHAVGLPAPNRSHFEAMELVEDAGPGSSARRGWINRMIGLDPGAGQADAVQLGSSILPTALVGPAPALGLPALSSLRLPVYGEEAPLRTALTTAWGATTAPLGEAVRAALDTTRSLRTLADDPLDPQHGAVYPYGQLRDVLLNTAALIRADVGAKIVTIDYGDWDMHAGVGEVDTGWMHDQLTHLAGSLAAFFRDLGAVSSRVTLLTISEFGRRVEENGDRGLDHGYGNCMLALGAGVRGGAVRGTWPGLDSLADGDVPMANDYRNVLADVLANRFPGTDVAAVFPGLVRRPTGIMA